MHILFRRGACRICWLALFVASPAWCQHANESEANVEAAPWSATVSIGVNSWSALQDLNPDVGGGFNAVGWNFDLGVHRHVTRWGTADVLVGADFGLFGTEGNIPGIVEDYTQRGLYLTPSARFRFGERSVRHLDVEVGVGWYEVDIVELFCDSGGCSELDEPFNSDQLGGYLGISGGFGGWFVMGLRAHMVDFGEVSGFGSNAGSLDGPVFTFTVGASWGGR